MGRETHIINRQAETSLRQGYGPGKHLPLHRTSLSVAYFSASPGSTLGKSAYTDILWLSRPLRLPRI